MCSIDHDMGSPDVSRVLMMMAKASGSTVTIEGRVCKGVSFDGRDVPDYEFKCDHCLAVAKQIVEEVFGVVN